MNPIYSGIPGGSSNSYSGPYQSNDGPPVPTGPAPPGTVGTPSTNPLIPAYPTGSSAPSMTFPANTGGEDPNQLLQALTGLGSTVTGFTTGTPGAAGGPTQQWYNQLTQAFHKAGYPSAIGGLLAAFIANGAGYNPQVAQSLLAALQPGIERGQANIMEQFGAEGLGSSSAAAIGLGDFMSQATLDEGQILSNLYEQSVQNYMQVLLSGKEQPSQLGGIGALLGGAGSLAKSLGQLIPSGGSGSSSGGGSSGTSSDDMDAIMSSMTSDD